MSKQHNPYEDFENFSSRLRVETTFAEGDVRDHRDGFTQREYRRNMQDTPETTEEKGFPAMKGVVKAPKPKRKPKKTTTDEQDAALNQAAKKDLRTRNLQ